MASELICDISQDFRFRIDCSHWQMEGDCCQKPSPFAWKTTVEVTFEPSIAIVIDPNDINFSDGHKLPGFRELSEYLGPIENYCLDNDLELIVYNSGSRTNLIKALEHGHLIVIVYHHGTKDQILCSESADISYYNDFDKISLNLGCLISYSCWGNEAKVTVLDEEDDYLDEEYTLLEWLQHQCIPCGFISIEEGHYSPQTKHQIDESKLNAYLISLLLNRDFESVWNHYRTNAPLGFHEHFRPFGNMKLRLSGLLND